VWTRPEGIEVTKPLDGYVCLKYLPNAPSTTSTTTTTINPALFRPVTGDGTEQVCRGDGPGDNKPEYFVVPSGVFTLEECKAECVALEECKGLEHHIAGRCELWIRPEGIGSTVGASGYTCLVYGPRDPDLFEPVSGDGTNQVCRGDGPGDNLGSYFTVVSGLQSLKQCKAACIEASDCKGIEYHQSGRCEIWIRPEGIGSIIDNKEGYTCLRYAPDITNSF